MNNENVLTDPFIDVPFVQVEEPTPKNTPPENSPQESELQPSNAMRVRTHRRRSLSCGPIFLAPQSPATRDLERRESLSQNLRRTVSKVGKFYNTKRRHVTETAQAIFSKTQKFETDAVRIEQMDDISTNGDYDGDAACTTVRSMSQFLQSSLDRTINTPWARDFAPFLLCVLAFSLAIFVERDSISVSPEFFAAHRIERSIAKTAFKTKEIDEALTFMEIRNDVEYYAWLEGPLASIFFEEDDARDSKFGSVNVPVGVLTIRQMRTAVVPCMNWDRLATISLSRRYIHASNRTGARAPLLCYMPFDPFHGADTLPFRGFTSDKDRVDLIEKGLLSREQMPPLYDAIGGWVRRYPDKCRDQFSISVPVNTSRQDFIRIIGNLSNASWVDDATRVMSVELTFFNTNLQCFFVTKFTIEVTDGGSFEPWTALNPIVLFPYGRDRDPKYFLIVLHLLLVLYFLYDLYRFGQRLLFRWVYYRRFLLLFNFWNVVNLCHFGFFWTAFKTKIEFLIFCNFFTPDQLFGNNEVAAKYGGMNNYAVYLFSYGSTLYDSAYEYTAFVAVVAWVRLLIYVEHIPKLNIITFTVREAIGILLGVLVLLFVLVMGYSIMGHVLYGKAMIEFRTYGDAAYTLVLCLFGAFPNLIVMDNLRPRFVTTFFMGSFLIVCWMMMLNIVLAIITDAFYTTKQKTNYTSQSNTFSVLLTRLERYVAQRCDEAFTAMKLTGLALYFRRQSSPNKKDDGSSHLGQMDEVLSLTFVLRDTITSVRNFREMSNIGLLLEEWSSQGKSDELVYYSSLKSLLTHQANIIITEEQWNILKKFIEVSYKRNVEKIQGNLSSTIKSLRSGSLKGSFPKTPTLNRINLSFRNLFKEESPESAGDKSDTFKEQTELEDEEMVMRTEQQNSSTRLYESAGDSGTRRPSI